MRVLVAHNFYQQPGGEDQVFRSELELLRSRGLDPVAFEMHNDDVQAMGKIALAASTVWNRSSSARLADAVREHRIDVVHLHNTFPLISPSAYYAARDAGAAVVQTLHNFRLLCPGANFFRDGQVCEKCMGKAVPLAGIRHKCYRDSTMASAGVVAMLTTHRAMGTYGSAVDAYITPTRFAREKFVTGGLPAEKIHVKPNFVDPDPGIGAGGGGYAIFVGRLSHEKGLDALLGAWARADSADLPPLKIVGNGPRAEQVMEAAADYPSTIEWLGPKPMSDVLDLIGRAELLVFPSECYETFGRTAVEAFAKGVPVIASGHGAPADVVDDGRTGLWFKPGDSLDLAAKVRRLMADAPLRAAMRRDVRREYETKYTGATNFQMLMDIYERARAGRPAAAGESGAAAMTASAASASASAASVVPVPRT